MVGHQFGSEQGAGLEGTVSKNARAKSVNGKNRCLIKIVEGAFQLALDFFAIGNSRDNCIDERPLCFATTGTSARFCQNLTNTTA
ncbi:MAG: hypothetical protein DMF40_08385 [Verrucomicrobia bacterium]|nr:MAG: hypothetical protein DMF40_08385 [Verrucomicrobiota bacterium]